MFKQKGFLYLFTVLGSSSTFGLVLTKISMSDVDKLILFVIVDIWCH
jgi:hypothetical protein